jgi:hypothetical protein
MRNFGVYMKLFKLAVHLRSLGDEGCLQYLVDRVAIEALKGKRFYVIDWSHPMFHNRDREELEKGLLERFDMFSHEVEPDISIIKISLENA